MKRGVLFTGIIFLFTFFAFAQTPDWTLKFSSTVEKDGAGCPGALITVSQGSSKIASAVTAADGNFVVEIPPNGDFVVTITKEGCNSKKFAINTTGVPADMNKNNFKAVVRIEGITMSKPLYSIDYSGISQPMTKIAYYPDKKKFTDDEAYTNQMLAVLTKIREAERILMEKYNSANKAGDAALLKNDCDNAKLNYTNAGNLLPDEKYPKEQLLKVDNCFKAKEDAKKKADELAAAKAKEDAAKQAAAKAAADKLAEEKAAKERAAIEKAEAELAAKEKALEEKEKADKAAKEKAAADKLAAEKAAAEKAEADRIAKEKAASEKAAADKLAAEKVAADKAAAEKAAAEKAEADRIAKEKAAAEKAAADKMAAERAAVDKAAADKAAAEKAEADRLAKEKAAAEKAAADKIAAEKAAADKALAEKALAEKAEAERLAKEKANSEKTAAQKAAAEKAAAEKAAKERAAIEKEEAALAAKEKALEEKEKAAAAKANKAAADKAAKEKAAAEKAEAERLAKEKAEADKAAAEKASPTNSQNTSTISGAGTGPENIDIGTAKHSIPQTLGSIETKYKDALKKAEGYFKMKRYEEAKTAYEEVLKIKSTDPYATNKLAEVNKLLNK